MTSKPADVPSSPLAAPLTFKRGAAWPNRLAVAPLTNHQSNWDGSASDQEIHWLQRRARGGFGMVMTAAAHVSPAGKTFTGQLGAFDDSLLPGLSRIAQTLHNEGSRAILQLHHGGRRAHQKFSGHAPVAPWDDPSTGALALTTAEVLDVVDDFVASAVRAEKAGFDGVEVHGAHGYLIGQFLDGHHNHREDGFGGSLEDRSRFLDLVLSGIRDTTSCDFQIGVRLTPERNGILLSEAVWLAEHVISSGTIDFLDMSLWDAFKTPYEDQHGGRLLLNYFTELPRGEVRLGVAGKILTAGNALACLDAGVDFVLIGTGAILHHDFALRALGDGSFASVAQPVSREHLRSEGLGEPFIEYLANDWDDFVS